MMDKYGVDESAETPDSLEKTAKESGTCPKCNGRIERHGQVYICPNCGSEPFEDKKQT